MRRLLLALLLLGCAPEEAPAPAAETSAPPRSLAGLVPSPSPVLYGSDTIPIGAFVYYEDFEKGFRGWELPKDPTGVALRALRAPACGGLWTVHLGLPGQREFAPVAGHHVLTKTAPLDLTRAKRPQLKFDVKGLTQPVEALHMTAEIRPPGGSWQPIGRPIKGGYMFVASIVADLTPWAGRFLGLRFVYDMAPAEAKTKGFYLDDIMVIEPQG